VFYESPFALHRQQPEKYKQNLDIAAHWKNFCGRPCRPRHGCSVCFQCDLCTCFL